MKKSFRESAGPIVKGIVKDFFPFGAFLVSNLLASEALRFNLSDGGFNLRRDGPLVVAVLASSAGGFVWAVRFNSRNWPANR